MISYVFKRYELKYLLTQEQYLKVRDEIEKRLSPDVFGKTVIQSLYYDTADDRLVRASNEKPVFKEKLRLRAYGLSDGEKDVYIEMKRKYDGVVPLSRQTTTASTPKMTSRSKISLCPSHARTMRSKATTA